MNEYALKLELTLGRLLYASRLIMDIVATDGIGDDEAASEQAVTEMQTARRNAQAVLDGGHLTRADAERRGVELVTIAQAAEMTGLAVQTIASRLDRGALATYIDPDAPNPRRGRRLVDRAELTERQGA